MTEISLITILHDALDQLYDAIPSKDNQIVVKEIYHQLINPEATILNSILEKKPQLTKDSYQFNRIVIILTIISDFFEYYSYNHYIEDTDKPSDEIYKILNDDCDFKKAIRLFFKNGRYAKKIIETYTIYNKDDKAKYIENLLEKGQMDKVLKINPYVFIEYMQSFNNKVSEEEKIICILKECAINDDNGKITNILNSNLTDFNNDNEEDINKLQSLNSNQLLKASFLKKLHDNYNGDKNSIHKAIRYIVYDVLNGIIKLSNQNLVDSYTMKIILNITDNNLDNQEKIVDEFINNEVFSNAVLDIFNDIHYTYDGLMDLLIENNINDSTKTLIKKYNPFEQDN